MISMRIAGVPKHSDLDLVVSWLKEMERLSSSQPNRFGLGVA